VRGLGVLEFGPDFIRQAIDDFGEGEGVFIGGDAELVVEDAAQGGGVHDHGEGGRLETENALMDGPGGVIEDGPHAAVIPPFVEVHFGEEFGGESPGIIAEGVFDDELQGVALLLHGDGGDGVTVAGVAFVVTVVMSTADPVGGDADGAELSAEEEFIAAAGFGPTVAFFHHTVEDFFAEVVDKAGLGFAEVEGVFAHVEGAGGGIGGEGVFIGAVSEAGFGDSFEDGFEVSFEGIAVFDGPEVVGADGDHGVFALDGAIIEVDVGGVVVHDGAGDGLAF